MGLGVHQSPPGCVCGRRFKDGPIRDEPGSGRCDPSPAPARGEFEFSLPTCQLAVVGSRARRSEGGRGEATSHTGTRGSAS